MKDIEFMDRMVEKIDGDIKEYDNEELIRPDKNQNNLIKKFQKWEKFLIDEQEKKIDMDDESILEQRSEIQDSNF